MVLPDSLHHQQAHLSVQKGPGLHAEERPVEYSQPGGPIPAGGPQAALQSQCSVLSVSLEPGLLHPFRLGSETLSLFIKNTIWPTAYFHYREIVKEKQGSESV